MSLSAIFLSSRTDSMLHHLFDEELHAKTILSLHHAVLGSLHAARAGIAAIGEGLADARGTRRKHAIKQVDRLVSNPHLDTVELAPTWLKFVLADRRDIIVVLDWTEFPKDEHHTLCLSLVNQSGRTTPLLWQTVHKSELTLQRNAIEDSLLERFRAALPQDVHATVLCDRGFCDQALYLFLSALDLDFIIRFRESILVTDANGITMPARDFIPENGRAKALVGAKVTGDKTKVAQVVVTRKKGAKQAWCLCTSRADLTAAQVVHFYARRFTTEEEFRDQKNFHLGMGLSASRIKSPERRDRLLFVIVLAQVLLHVLGAAGESRGLDRWMKVNTRPGRAHSLFHQGQYYYRHLVSMPAEEAGALLLRFDQLLRAHPLCKEVFALL